MNMFLFYIIIILRITIIIIVSTNNKILFHDSFTHTLFSPSLWTIPESQPKHIAEPEILRLLRTGNFLHHIHFKDEKQQTNRVEQKPALLQQRFDCSSQKINEF